MKKVYLILLAFLFSLVATAQETDFSGRDFWTTSLDNLNLNGPDSALIYIMGDTACAGYLENPNTSYYQSFNVVPGQVTLIHIPENEIQCDYGLQSSQLKGIHISTTSNVYAFLQTSTQDSISNWIYDSWGNMIIQLTPEENRTKKVPIIPTHLLNSKQQFRGMCVGLATTLFVIALEDSTNVSWSDGGTLIETISLNRGEVKRFAHQHVWSNIHSLKQCIESNCKKIAVYCCASRGWFYPSLNPYYYDGLDYIVKVNGNQNFSKQLVPFINNYNPEPDTFQCYICNRLTDTPIYYITNQLGDARTRPIVYHDVLCNNLTPPFLYNVPYLFYRFSEYPRRKYFFFSIHSALNGNYEYMGTGSWRTIYTQHINLFANAMILPNDIMVTHWLVPTTRNNVQILNEHIDTTFAELDIYVHENGIGTTYFNGQLLPASAFDSVPYTNRDYYVAQLDFYNEDIPEIIRVENPNGFSAYLDEFGYSQEVSNPDYIRLYYYHDNNSGPNIDKAPVEHSNLSPHNLDTVYRCLGDSLLLTVEHNPDSLSFDWIVDGVTHYDIRTMQVPLTDLDTLVAQLVIHYPCPDTITTFVVVVPPPVIPFGMDTTICAGSSISVLNENALSYLWSTGDTTPAISIDTAGIYSVTVTNRGCTANLDSFHVDLFEPSAVDFGPDTLLCELAHLLLDAEQTHPATYEWQDHSTNTSYNVVRHGDYWVVITDHCLGATDSINVGFLNDFVLDLGPDTTLCEGDELRLSPGIPFCTYEWQDGSTADCYVVEHPGDYSVTAANRCFTHNDDIVVDYQSCEQELYLPNSFSPNGDGLNDRFAPLFSYPDAIESFQLLVYDRWGSLIFETRDPNAGWDGRGAPLGVYAYLIRYKTSGWAERLVKGSMTLIP